MGKFKDKETLNFRCLVRAGPLPMNCNNVIGLDLSSLKKFPFREPYACLHVYLTCYHFDSCILTYM